MKVMKKSNGLFFVAFILFTVVSLVGCDFAVSWVHSPAAGPLRITLEPADSSAAKPGATSAHAIVVSGLSGQELRSLRAAGWNDDAWQALLRVSVTGHEATPVVGRYSVTASACSSSRGFRSIPAARIRSGSIRPGFRHPEATKCSSRPSRFPRVRSARRPLSPRFIPRRARGLRTCCASTFIFPRRCPRRPASTTCT